MYSIEIKRGLRHGSLRLSGTSLIYKCWWDVRKKIPAGNYPNCSATTMTNKKNSKGAPREAIFIPGVVGYSGIFIHMGTGSSWSDGCIVIEEANMLTIYNQIIQKNGLNITVSIQNNR